MFLVNYWLGLSLAYEDVEVLIEPISNRINEKANNFDVFIISRSH